MYPIANRLVILCSWFSLYTCR